MIFLNFNGNLIYFLILLFNSSKYLISSFWCKNNKNVEFCLYCQYSYDLHCLITTSLSSFSFTTTLNSISNA